MSDEVGAAVIESPEASQIDIPAEVPTESTDAIDGKAKPEEQERLDGRKQPDTMRRHAAELKRQAAEEADPVRKQDLLDRAKRINDGFGKLGGYEQVWGKVSEAREVKALLDSVGGRNGFIQMQSVFSEVEKFNQQLSIGDPKAVEQLWADAPDGMPKLIPALLDKFAQAKPQEYEQFIAPKTIGFLDSQGFPQAFDRMVQLYEGGKTTEAQELRDKLTEWVRANRQQAQQQPKTDPEVERLRQELATRDEKEKAGKIDGAYNAVMTHGSSTIDQFLKPMVAKLGLTAEAYQALRRDVWNHLQDTRNADATYKTVAPSKERQGYDQWTEYAKRWTTDNAEASARAMVKTRYGHQLQNGTQVTRPATTPPGATQIQRGAAPSASEIDYSVKGKIAAQKAGFKDLEDMILSGQAPLRAGGIRKWR